MKGIKKVFARISDKSQGALVGLVKPFVKRWLLKAMKDYKDEVMDTLKKIDIPKMTKKEEQVFWNRLYDNVVTALTCIIEKV